MTPLGRATSNLILQGSEPLNAETPPERLIAAYLTPQKYFYVRSHGSIPHLADEHRVEVSGLLQRCASFSVAELRRDFAERTVTATMQCAGNRRAHLQDVAKTSGDRWDIGAIGNAEWTGVSLAEVLLSLGIGQDARFVAASSADEVDVDGEVEAFGISIPLDKALDPDVLLAWAMNGEPLLPEQGAPLRLVVPGFAGVRSAKWLTSLEVRNRPSDAPIQAKDYKLFPASVTKAEADWSKGLTIDAMPLNAAICSPADGASITSGPVSIKGYATASGRQVGRVDISVNGGDEWAEAELTQALDKPWSWTQWQATIDLPPGEHVLVVRAIDAAGQMQTERPGPIWNFAGYLSTAWHHILVTAA